MNFKIIKKILPHKIYENIKKIYQSVYFYKARNYNLQKDLDHNEDLLHSIGMDIGKIKLNLDKFGYNYFDENLSWHYHLFAGLNQVFDNKKINILEIGTHDGSFTNFLSKIFSQSFITTIDLDDIDEQFLHSYKRDDNKILNQFLETRNSNIKRDNISFIKLNSIHIKKYFKDVKFDIIWIDGDHLNPQVTIDIINSLDLINENGIICLDDVIKNKKFKRNDLVSNESYQTISHLEKNQVIKNCYLNKRIRKKNFYNKKYVSLSFFLKKNFFKSL